MDEMFDEKPKRGAGGTSGGLLEFFIGAVLIMVGGYLFISRVTVTMPRGFGIPMPGRFGGGMFNSFGLAILPLLIGIGLLFFNGRSIAGWLLTIGGSAIIILGIVVNLSIVFRPTNLFDTLLMLGMIAAGLGLVARALQPHG